MSDDLKALLGRTFKQTYLLEAHVETGGMAYLFRARHLSLDTPVALKILQPHLARQAPMKRRFLQEARLQFQLHHPHIIRALDVVDEGDWLGMVMEWIHGCDLQALLEGHDGPLPVPWTWAIAAPVIEALVYAHGAKDAWVHRDIKPSNIMLAEVEGQIVPKLGDFGIARALSGDGAGTDGAGLGSEPIPDATPAAAACQEGSVRRCFGPGAVKAGFVPRGRCKVGQQRCHNGRFGPCVGAILPRAESCNENDDDCDGQIDEDFPRKGRRCQARAGLCAVAGRWRCHRRGHLVCAADRSRPAKRGARQVRIRLRPPGVTFALTLGRHQIRARRWTCLPLPRRGMLTIKAPGFQRCIVPLTFAHQRLWLQLKRHSLLAEEPPYCLRRRAVGAGQ